MLCLVICVSSGMLMIPGRPSGLGGVLFVFRFFCSRFPDACSRHELTNSARGTNFFANSSIIRF